MALAAALLLVPSKQAQSSDDAVVQGRFAKQVLGVDDPAARAAAFELALAETLTDDSIVAITRGLVRSDEYVSSTCWRVLMREVARKDAVALLLSIVQRRELEGAVFDRVESVLCRWCRDDAIEGGAIRALVHSERGSARHVGLKLIGVASAQLVASVASPEFVTRVQRAYESAPSEALADACADAIAAMDPRSCVTSDDEVLRWTLLRRVRRTSMDLDEILAFVLLSLNESDPRLRGAASAALAEFATHPAAARRVELRNALVALAGHREPLQRQQAAFGLGYLEGLSEREVRALDALSRDDDTDVRRMAASSRFRAAPTDSGKARVLQQCAESEDAALRWVATGIARLAADVPGLRPQAVTALTRLAGDSEVDVQRWAVTRLADARITDKAAVASIGEALRTTVDPRVRTAALVALAGLGTAAQDQESVVEPLRSSVEDRVAGLAAMALVAMKASAEGSPARQWRALVLRSLESARSLGGLAYAVSDHLVEEVFLESLLSMLDDEETCRIAIEASVALELRSPRLLEHLGRLRVTASAPVRAAADHALALRVR